MAKRSSTFYLLLLPLLILAVVLLDRVEQPAKVVTEDTINMRDTQSDYYLSDFRTRRFGENGQIEFIVHGKTLAHYPDDNRSEIIEPKLELRRADALWLAESSSGRYDPAPDLFTLRGDVTVTRILSNEQQGDRSPEPITMTTSLLSIANEANLLETDQLVKITAPKWQLQSKGLTTTIDDGQLKLLAQVIGRFDSPVVAQ